MTTSAMEEKKEHPNVLLGGFLKSIITEEKDYLTPEEADEALEMLKSAFESGQKEIQRQESKKAQEENERSVSQQMITSSQEMTVKTSHLQVVEPMSARVEETARVEIKPPARHPIIITDSARIIMETLHESPSIKNLRERLLASQTETIDSSRQSSPLYAKECEQELKTLSKPEQLQNGISPLVVQSDNKYKFDRLPKSSCRQSLPESTGPNPYKFSRLL